MDVRKIVVMVEDEEVARTALKWALHNIIRYGDIITLLHVYHSSSSSSSRTRTRSKSRLLRLNGYQLALSFQHICNSHPNTKVEIIVTEGDQEGTKIAATVRELGASVLVVGLHDHSFLYRLAMAHSPNSMARHFNCRVLAIKQPPTPPLRPSVSVLDSATNMDFSQIDISRLKVPQMPPPKTPYRICPDPYAIIWRLRRARRS
ncbi:hypothetical protein HN51_032601 [Arachis hypogaea]|uniref:UspA domain-containing protein n=2 Tax=Arachis TaxID=3817 RepID=A0A445B3X0_ARAHY|nr:uncharacterized protein LOC107470951 [Arachis duranensis]XP_025623875.1 uncharacterized protein LOC112716224 isoform X1 [Arachis hypogaea]XP_057738860.1 uncharacterized protein LOC130955883 [Arachis stenosperma]RYR33385.1 hypothetical protein Ahy_A10g047965 [Arachis hypogaea]